MVFTVDTAFIVVKQQIHLYIRTIIISIIKNMGDFTLKVKNSAFKLGTRRTIYHTILENPGIHFRELCRELHIPRSTMNYHLLYLKKRGLIIPNSEYGYTRHFVVNDMKDDEKKVLILLRQETPRSIILYLLTRIYASQNEISNVLRKHTTTIEFHLKKLIDNKIISIAKPIDGKIYLNFTPHVAKCKPIGNEIIYVLNDPYAIYDLLVTYKESLITDEIDNTILDYLDDLISEGIPEHVNDHREMIDLVIDAYFEIFPHPYHV